MTTCTATHRPMRAALAARHDSEVEPLTCHRDVDEHGRHRGDHQAIEHVPALPPGTDLLGRHPGRPAFESLVTWGTGGASGGSDIANLALNCMGCDGRNNRRVTHAPETHGLIPCASCGALFDGYTGAEVCGTCSYWEYRRFAMVNEAGWTDRARRGAARPRLVVPHGREDRVLYVWSPEHGGAFGGRKYRVTWDDGETAGPADFLWWNGVVPWWMADDFAPNATIEADGVTLRPGHTTDGRPLDFNGGPAPA